MPIEPCGCTKNYDDYLALFPDGTTDAEIANSIKEGTEKQAKKDQENQALDIPEKWPKCEDHWDCEFGTFNYLACTCFSDIMCMLWCGEDMQLDPTKGCSCITQAEYLAYFPDWADEKDIDFSYKLQYEDFERKHGLVPEPEPVQDHPGIWPRC